MVTQQTAPKANDRKMPLRAFELAMQGMQKDIEKAYAKPNFPAERERIERVHTHAIIQICQF